MALRLKRRIGLLVIALLVFAQGSVALAACAMERGAAMQMTQADDAYPCDTQAGFEAPMHANVCVAHCTSDLQLAGVATALVRAPAAAPVLVVALVREYSPGRMAREAPPPHAVPPRILLHSFLI